MPNIFGSMFINFQQNSGRFLHKFKKKKLRKRRKSWSNFEDLKINIFSVSCLKLSRDWWEIFKNFKENLNWYHIVLKIYNRYRKWETWWNSCGYLKSQMNLLFSTSSLLFNHSLKVGWKNMYVLSVRLMRNSDSVCKNKTRGRLIRIRAGRGNREFAWGSHILRWHNWSKVCFGFFFIFLDYLRFFLENGTAFP